MTELQNGICINKAETSAGPFFFAANSVAKMRGKEMICVFIRVGDFFSLSLFRNERQAGSKVRVSFFFNPLTYLWRKLLDTTLMKSLFPPSHKEIC